MTKEIQKICEAIANGEETEKYIIWKTSSENDIRKALAKAGHWPEYFIHDADNFVRVAVLNKHPEYVNELLKNPINHADIHWFVYRKPSPDIRILKALSEYGANEHQTTGVQATTLNLKLKALETVRTPLQSTMNRRQLFEAQSPLWAIDLDMELGGTCLNGFMKLPFIQDFNYLRRHNPMIDRHLDVLFLRF